MYELDQIDLSPLTINRPVKISEKVSLIAPKVKDVIDNDDYSYSVRVFTIMTREIFARDRNIEALVDKFPSIWSFLWSEETNETVGEFLSGEEGMTAQDAVIKSFCFWTDLNPEGFKVLENRKRLVHLDANFVITGKVFVQFSNLIKNIVAYAPPEDLAPKITSDSRHQAWLRFHDNLLKKQERQRVTWSDKLIRLSVGYGIYIPMDEILEMSIFTFLNTEQLFAKKESYDIRMRYVFSEKFQLKDGQGMPSHWQETFKTQHYR